MQAITVDIFEAAVGDDYPVVRHVFYGRTLAEAEGYETAHRATDSFYRGCVEDGEFQLNDSTIRCRAERTVREVRASELTSSNRTGLFLGAAGFALFAAFGGWLVGSVVQ